MDDNQVTQDLHNAIATALMNHETAMLGPWVLVAQSTTDDGKRGVWLQTADDNMDYETKGLLVDALDRIRDNADYSWMHDDTDDQD